MPGNTIAFRVYNPQVTCYTATVERPPVPQAAFPRQPDLVQDVQHKTPALSNGHSETSQNISSTRANGVNGATTSIDKDVGQLAEALDTLSEKTEVLSQSPRSPDLHEIRGVNGVKKSLDDTEDTYRSISSFKSNLISDLADVLKETARLDDAVQALLHGEVVVQPPPPYHFEPPPPYVVFGPCGPNCYRNRLPKGALKGN